MYMYVILIALIVICQRTELKLIVICDNNQEKKVVKEVVYSVKMMTNGKAVDDMTGEMLKYRRDLLTEWLCNSFKCV